MKRLILGLSLLLSTSLVSAQGISANYVRLLPSTLPSICNIGDMRTNSSNSLLEFCTGSNTWTPMLISAAPISVANGGTGRATLTAHGVLIGEGTSNVNITTAGTSGYPLISGGGSADPSFTPLSLSGVGVTGTLSVGNGGTGITSTSQNFVFAGPTSGSGAPTWRALVTADLPAAGNGYTTPTTGSNFLGATASGSLTGVDVTAHGVGSGTADTSGHDNTFLGFDAGISVTTGSNNTILGAQTSAGSVLTSGARNTLIGSTVVPGGAVITDTVSIGNGTGTAAIGNSGDVVIGSLAQGGASNQTGNTTLAAVSIGYSANGNASYSAGDAVTIGAFSSAGGADDIILGVGVQSNSSDTFVAGHGGNTVSTNYIATSAANQISFGTSTKALKDLFLGSGAAAVAAPTNVTIQPTPVLAGTADTAGASLTLLGGNSTGQGAGGSIVFKTAAAAGGSGSSVNTLTQAASIDSTGALNLGVNATSTGLLNLATSAGSGTYITVKNGGATSAYNFILPTTVGSAGTVLTSQGGGSTAMTWTAALTNPMTTGGDVIYGGSSGAATRLANGSGGQVLTSSGGTAAPTWTSVASIADPTELKNVGIANSVGSSNWTINLKQADGATDPAASSGAVKVAFRSSTATSGAFNERSITGTLSQVITSGTTLGTFSGVTSNVWLYLIDSDGAGTMKIGASGALYDETALQSTVAESASATATNASPCVFTINGHGYNNGDQVALTGTVPATGFATGTVYYVVAKTTNTFELAATPGGSAINSTSTGSSVVVHQAGSRLVADAAYTNMPVRVIGLATMSESAAGTWASAANPLVVGVALNKQIDNPAASYYDASGMSIPASTTTVINFNTKAIDNANSVTTGTAWKFIAPTTGTYEVSASVSFGSQAWANSNSMSMTLYKNGSSYFQLAQAPIWVTETVANNSMSGTIFIALAQNDYIDLRVFQNNSSTRTLLANGSQINIRRIGD